MGNLVEITIKAVDDTGPAVAAAIIKINGLKAATADLNKGLYDNETAATAASAALNTLSYGWFRASGDVKTFGGALDAVGAPKILSQVGAMHLLMDSFIEFTAVVVPATIAFTAFAIAAAPTVEAIVKHLMDANTVATAFGSTIYPLSGGFSNLANSVKPEVYELFGEALVAAGNHGGDLETVVQGVGRALDSLGARAVAALGGGGLDGMIKSGTSDMFKIDSVIGNVFGTLGNLMKVVPGYAHDILDAFEGISGALESFTGNSIVQGFLGVALAVHGFVVWGGIAVTMAVGLGNAMVGLAAKFGLAEEGALAFNAVAFGAAIKEMVSGVVLLGGELVTLGASEDIAAAATLTFDAAMDALAAVNPMVWIGAAIAGLIALGVWMKNTQSATEGYDKAINGALDNAPVNQLGIDLATQMADVTGKLTVAQKVANQQASLWGTIISGVTGGLDHLNGVTIGHESVIASLQSEYATLSTAQSNYNTLVKAAGGNLGYLNAAGITSQDIMSASTNQMKQYVIEVEAQKDALEALTLGVGRNGAAMNALSNNYINSTLPSLQKVTAAEDTLISTILSGEQAFIGFEQGIQQMSTDAKAAGASMGGLNSQSLTLAGDFYNTVVPGAQKVIDALQQQNISAGNLTTVVATQSRQMLNLAGSNQTAKGVIVDLINNALGPGTVSLQNVDSWVNKNSGSLQKMNGIIGQSTAQAGQLAGILNAQVTQALSASALETSGFTTNLKILQGALSNHAPAATLQADAQKVFDSLVHSGVGANTAKGDVDNYFKALGLIPPNINTKINVNSQSAIDSVAAFTRYFNAQQGDTIYDYINVSTKKAMGGVIGAASGGARSGLTLVGENGPELVHLPTGSTVSSNADSQAAMSGGGTTTVQLEVTGGQGAFDQFMLNWMRNNVRVKGGGSVQRAFGNH